VAHGYGPEGDWGTPLDKAWAPDGPWWNLRGNGGILSTVGDFYKWHQALEGEAILSKEEKEKYFKPWVPENEEGSSFYGYGWAIARTPRGTRLITHNGGNGIFGADFRRYVDEGVVIIAGSNQASFPIFPVSNQIARLVFGMDVAIPPEVVHVEPAVLKGYTGTYELPAGGGKLIVKAAGPALSIAAEGKEAFALLGGGSREDRAPWEKRQDRLQKAMERSHAGDSAALSELFGKPLAEMTQQAKSNWHRLEEAHGPFQGIDVLGSTPRGARGATYLRLRFARSPVLAEYTWEGDEIATVRFLDDLPGTLFRPLSSTEVASYDQRTQAVLHIRFNAAPAGKERPSLVVEGPQGEVKAVRTEETAR
jgi:hypothetical protein